jgi:flagellar capping protein FliD
MAGAISFSGLGSGMNTKGIVDALVNVEKAPINALNKKKQNLSKHQRIYNDVSSLLKNLKSESETLKTTKDFFVYKSTVSVGDTCKEIGFTSHGSDDADKVQRHNAEGLSVNRNFELSPRQIVCRRLNWDRVL